MSFIFSDRTEWCLAPNALTQRVESLRERGVKLLDMTELNPTRCGIEYPSDLLTNLADPSGLLYQPAPKGLPAARQAVASVYQAKGVSISSDRIFLTASTSETYSFLFRLLCNPEDQVLVPQPSYPLFEYLADLNDVKTIPYSLHYRERWRIDCPRLSQAITTTTRAIVVVHPNHPTGSCVTREEWLFLKRLCAERQITLISDEVFADYCQQRDSSIPPTLAGDPEILTFSLGGISKFLGLPQMKLAWCVATGPSTLLHTALERLEMIADTFLSVNSPVQEALPRWLQKAPLIQSRIRSRLDSNRQFLEEQTRAGGVQCLAADGGWSAVLHLPSLEEEEAWVLQLLEEDHLLVHPGYFFDFEESGYVVVSLLVPTALFQEGLIRLSQRGKELSRR